jgi:hypothetical protein
MEPEDHELPIFRHQRIMNICFYQLAVEVWQLPAGKWENRVTNVQRPVLKRQKDQAVGRGPLMIVE